MYQLNEYGLREKDTNFMISLFATFAEIESVILFGSRAEGTYKHASDIDLAVIGANIPDQTVAKIHFILEEESPTLLFFDVLNYHAIENLKLKQQIDLTGKIIYTKNHNH